MRRFVRLSKIAHIWKFVRACDVASMFNVQCSMLTTRCADASTCDAGFDRFGPRALGMSNSRPQSKHTR